LSSRKTSPASGNSVVLKLALMGENPSAHQAAEPQEKALVSSCVDTNATLPQSTLPPVLVGKFSSHCTEQRRVEASPGKALRSYGKDFAVTPEINVPANREIDPRTISSPLQRRRAPLSVGEQSKTFVFALSKCNMTKLCLDMLLQTGSPATTPMLRNCCSPSDPK
jgi:hypothetical protein